MSSIRVPVLKIGNLQRRTVCLALAVAAVFFLLFQTEVHFFEKSHRNVAGRGLLLAKEATFPPDFRFLIKVLTYNRLPSLSKCLDSLAAADYGADVVNLQIFVDHFEMDGAKEGSTIDQELKEAHDLLHYVDSFNWPHGPKEIHYRTQNAGLLGQWLEAWWPASNDEFAFIVEDDMRLSPLYYNYLRQVIKTYYYEPSNYDPAVYGISLQRPRFVPGKHGNPLQVDDNTHLFLYQLVGTWGQLLFPRPWKEFRIWYDMQKSKNIKPLLEGMVTTGWYHRSKERIWTPWFIKFVHCRGYFNLYTNFLKMRALSVSYREKGVSTKRTAGPDSELIGNYSSSEIGLWEMKPLKSLKRYNFCFHEVLQGKLVATFQDLKRILPSLHKDERVILINALGFPEIALRNWLCQFSKFGFKNYLLLLQDHGLVKEFLQKGHAVMHVNLEKDGAHAHLFNKVDMDDDKWIKHILIIVQAITWVLRAGYNVWLTKVDTLWAQDPFPSIIEFDGDLLGFAAGIGISTELLYSRSSEATVQLWKVVWSDILHQAESLISSKVTEIKEDILEASLWQCVLKSKVKVKFLSHNLTANIWTASRNTINSSSLSTPLLTGIQTSNLLTNLLKTLGLWVLDDEFSCTGVFCK